MRWMQAAHVTFSTSGPLTGHSRSRTLLSSSVSRSRIWLRCSSMNDTCEWANG